MSYENLSEELNCAQQTLMNVSLAEYPPALITTVAVLRVLYYIAVLLSGVALNMLVMILIAKDKKLQTTPLLAALQIVGTDLVIAVLLPLSILPSTIGGRWVLGWHMCTITGFLWFLCSITRMLLLPVLAIDRFLYVFAPFKYPNIKNKVVGLLSLLSWLIAIGACIFALPGILDCYGYRYIQYFCFAETSCNRRCFIYTTIFWFVFGSPAWVLPVLLYSSLCYKARKIRSNMTAAAGRPKIDHKATITFFLMFLSIFILNVPFNVSFFLIRALTDSAPAEFILTVLSDSTNHLVIVADPLFILRNMNAKMAIIKLGRSALKKWRSAVEACLLQYARLQTNTHPPVTTTTN